MNFKEHILSRCNSLPEFVTRRNIYLDIDNEILTFPLYTEDTLKFSGVLRYDWKGNKKSKTTPKYTLVGFGVWGLETVNATYNYILVVEGAFDALRLQEYGYNAVALLNNSGKHQIPRLRKAFPDKVIIAVCDGDKAGLNLSKYVDKFVQCPPNEDPNSTEEQLMRSILDKGINDE